MGLERLARIPPGDLDPDRLGRLRLHLGDPDRKDARIEGSVGLIEPAVAREHDLAQVVNGPQLLVDVIALGDLRPSPDREQAFAAAQVHPFGRHGRQRGFDDDRS